MYFCQQRSGVTLKQIADYFSVDSYFTVSKTIARLRDEMEEGSQHVRCEVGRIDMLLKMKE